MSPIFFISQLTYRIPGLLAALVGLILAARWVRRCPLASRMVMISCAAIALASVVSFAITVVYFPRSTGSFSQYAKITALVGLVNHLIDSGALVTIVLAVFVGRNRDEPLRAFPVEGIFAPPARSEHHG